MKCKSPISHCSGEMVMMCEHTKKETYVAAHKLPVFLQCNWCGFAFTPEEQPCKIKLFLEEFMKGL